MWYEKNINFIFGPYHAALAYCCVVAASDKFYIVDEHSSKNFVFSSFPPPLILNYFLLFIPSLHSSSISCPASVMFTQP